MNDKYKMFKNFLHNELGIEKADIREWIKESVQEEVKKVVAEAYDKFNMETIISKEVNRIVREPYGNFNKTITEAITKEILKNFEIKILGKGEVK
jgi:hypothetical protein